MKNRARGHYACFPYEFLCFFDPYKRSCIEKACINKNNRCKIYYKPHRERCKPLVHQSMQEDKKKAFQKSQVNLKPRGGHQKGTILSQKGKTRPLRNPKMKKTKPYIRIFNPF